MLATVYCLRPFDGNRVAKVQTLQTSLLAFVCGKTVQTGEEPVKVALLLASLDL